jgi:hypothetical protein
MVQVVVLSANGESRTLKTIAFSASAATGAGVAKALRKVKPAELVGFYTTKTGTKLSVWGWRSGKAGTENKHDLPPMGDGADEGLLFGDAVVVSNAGDYTVEQWEVFYDEAFGGFESLDSESEGGDEDGEEEADDDYEEEEEEEEEVDEEKEEEEDEDGDADEEDDEEEEEEEMEDDDCYDEGDENGGGAKRRAPRRRTIASPECRRIDMGLRSRIRLPAPVGKRAPRWQTAPELEAEAYA